jgi:hypothetical protein
MVVDLANTGFAFAAEWYWRIVEDDGAFGAAAARACLLPLARLAHGSFTIDAITASADDDVVDFRLQGTPISLPVGSRNPRASADRFVIDLNRELRAVDHAFALVVPRRYELRGVLLPRPALADHAYNRFVLAPSDRTGWRRVARGTTDL